MTEEQIQNFSYNETATLIIKQQAEIENLKTSYQRLTEQFELLADKVIKKDAEIERLKSLFKGEEQEKEDDYPTYEQSGGSKNWDEMTELEQAYYNIRKLKNALVVSTNTVKRLHSAAPPTPAEQEKEGIPAGNKIFSIYKQMPDCPLKVFLSKWFSYYDDAPTPAEEKGAGKGKRITLCGSTKFKREFEAINKQLTLEGNIVYTVCAFGHADKIDWTKEQKELLDEVHKRKIDNSDAIFVIDVDGYIGDSTRSEIDYANYKGKAVRYLSDFPDLKMICDYVTLSIAPAPHQEALQRIKTILQSKSFGTSSLNWYKEQMLTIIAQAATAP